MDFLNTLDLFVLGVFVLFMGLGAWKGLVKTLFQTLSWVAGAAGAWFGSAYISDFLKANIQGVPAFGLTAFSGFVGFLVCFVLFRLLGILIHNWIDKSVLGSLNRWGGLAFGAIKATILVILLFLLLGILPLQGEMLKMRDTSKCFQGWSWLAIQLELPAHASIISFQNGRIR